MTREEQIKEAAKEYSKDAFYPAPDYNWYESDDMAMKEVLANAFKAGIEWSNKHPKSPWINVQEDLPCNHSNLKSTECATVNVFVCKKGGSVSVDFMIKRNGKWEWDSWRESYTHWMPIPSV